MKFYQVILHDADNPNTGTIIAGLHDRLTLPAAKALAEREGRKFGKRASVRLWTAEQVWHFSPTA